MNLRLKNISFDISQEAINNLPVGKKMIATLNAHSFNLAQRDSEFATALLSSDVLIPDGISIVWATRLLTGKKIKKIAGADLFYYEMNRLQSEGGRCLFLGSSMEVLDKIKQKSVIEYPRIKVFTYSPPFVTEFSDADNGAMLEAINRVQPDVLFVGMTAPKQEKWAFRNLSSINTGHVCCIGAVFDFYAGTVKRAPGFMISLGLEWLYRLLAEPRRMWRRYLIGNTRFVYYVTREWIAGR